MNNRQSECSHGDLRLYTCGKEPVFIPLPLLYEYAEIHIVTRRLDMTKQKILEMQEFLLWDVRKITTNTKNFIGRFFLELCFTTLPFKFLTIHSLLFTNITTFVTSKHF